ncbi:MAG: hypothetical protein H7177_01345 [Rhizobacter sp.]|nr:hypothetical protein [Bacteriovorax sp.]
MKKYVFLGLMLVSYSAFAQDVYRLETKMGDKVFGDLLVIDSYKDRSFEGSLTVPGIFTSKIESPVLQELCAGKRMSFDVNVHENSQDYVVHYNLNITFIGFVSGTLSQDGVVIAKISGSQIYGGN